MQTDELVQGEESAPTEECKTCEDHESDKEMHDRDLNRGNLLFALEALVLALIVIVIPSLYWNWSIRQPTVASAVAGTHPFQYAAWFLAAMAGTLVYLLRNLAQWRTRRHRYRRHTTWNLSTLITGPIVALVVMWLLTNLTLAVTPEKVPGSSVVQITQSAEATETVPEQPSEASVASSTVATDVGSTADTTLTISSTASQDATPSVAGGIVLDVKMLSLQAQLALAFVLGYFGRTTTKQLEILTRKLLPEAWNLAETSDFEVVPARRRIVSGSSAQFWTSKEIEAVWSATGGEVSESTGIFTAPRLDMQVFSVERGAVTGLVSAHPKNLSSAVRSASVEIVPFEIQGDDTVKAGESVLYRSMPCVTDLRWTVAGPAQMDKKTGLLTAGSKDAGKTVVVTAKSASWNHSESKMVRIV